MIEAAINEGLRIVYPLSYSICVITKERSTLAADVRAERFLDFDARN